MCQIAEHRDAGHARTALQRVQVALQFVEERAVATIPAPGVDAGIDRGHQLLGLLEEDAQQLRICAGEIAGDALARRGRRCGGIRHVFGRHELIGHSSFDERLGRDFRLCGLGRFRCCSFGRLRCLGRRSCLDACSGICRGSHRAGFAAHQIHHLQQLLVVVLHALEEGIVEAAELHALIDQEGLDVVAEFAQMAQPRHARAALQGVQIALQTLERLAVVAVVAPVVDALVDGAQHLRGLFQEDAQQLRIGLLEFARDAGAQRFHLGHECLGNRLRLLHRHRFARARSERGQRGEQHRIERGLLTRGKAVERV